MWLKNITSDIENVEVFEIFDRNENKDTYDWQTGAEDIKKYIGTKIDAVFSGDDYRGKNIWEKLYTESEIIYFPRNEINISSTDASDTYSTYSMDYAASKAGIENVTKNLAKRLPKLKVCALAPNWVDTDTVLNMDRDYLESELKRIGQNRLLKKEEVALKIIEIIINDDIRSGEIIRMGGFNE